MIICLAHSYRRQFSLDQVNVQATFPYFHKSANSLTIMLTIEFSLIILDLRFNVVQEICSQVEFKQYFRSLDGCQLQFYLSHTRDSSCVLRFSLIMLCFEVPFMFNFMLTFLFNNECFFFLQFSMFVAFQGSFPFSNSQSYHSSSNCKEMESVGDIVLRKELCVCVCV